MGMFTVECTPWQQHSAVVLGPVVMMLKQSERLYVKYNEFELLT